jgi:metal transporter CNNM
MLLLTWIGIAFCLSQSAILSGLNLGLFSLTRLDLKVAIEKGDPRARRLMQVREDANHALVTILWANVAVNVLLALLSDSVMGAVGAFFFSTVVITLLAEIIPQSLFTRHALTLAAKLTPVLRVYQILFYPIARPTAWVLDLWLGGEDIRYIRERDMRQVIRLHMESAESDIAHVEGQGALNFLDIDDTVVDDEGEIIDPASVIQLDFDGGRPIFPRIEPSPDDEFLRAIHSSGMTWVVLVDAETEPRLVLQVNDFVREALFAPDIFSPYRHCHRPILTRDPKQRLGELIPRFRVKPGGEARDIVEDDVILFWGDTPRILTGTDILGRLLRGIAAPPFSR